MLLSRFFFRSHPAGVLLRRNLAVMSAEERKTKKLTTLRQLIVAHFKDNGDKVNWTTLQPTLDANGYSVRSNFEFALINAFDDQSEWLKELKKQDDMKLSQGLFTDLTVYIQQSPAVNSNKIAAVRFCLFLSSRYEFLTKEQSKYIRKVVEDAIIKPEEQVTLIPLIMDSMTALARSSKSNCLFALTIYERFLQQDFRLHRNLVNLLFQNCIKFELLEQSHELLMKHKNVITLEYDDTEAVIRLLSRKKSFSIPETETAAKTANYLELLGEIFLLPEEKNRQMLTEKVLKDKLGMTKIQFPVGTTLTGSCQFCGHQLPGISKAEVEYLQQKFEEIIFDKNENFLMENLSEHRLQLIEFNDLLELHRFDLIIDGLNVGYRRGSSFVIDKRGLRTFRKVMKVQEVDEQITTVIQSTVATGSYKRILLIGRHHMKKWYRLNQYLKENPSLVRPYFLLDRTDDDNYILLAAIKNPSARILSGDYYRDHHNKFAEGWSQPEMPNLPGLFNRWLRSRQIKFGFNDRLIVPKPNDVRIHQDGSRIHVPIIIERSDVYANGDHKIKWICGRK